MKFEIKFAVNWDFWIVSIQLYKKSAENSPFSINISENKLKHFRKSALWIRYFRLQTLRCDVETVSRIHKNIQNINIPSEKTSRHYLSPTAISKFSEKEITVL